MIAPKIKNLANKTKHYILISILFSSIFVNYFNEPISLITIGCTLP